MAVYKVPQDVEAEDKFLGPLTFKQFLFFGGTAIFGYVTFLTATKIWPIAPIFGIPTIVFAVLAIPWSKDQPTEVFLGARFKFLFKPRKRIWDQTGIKDLVKITVPKREAHVYSDGLTQKEVRKRFGALATMVDSRGWAIKSVPGLSPVNVAEESDRLVEAPRQSPSQNEVILASTDDVLDEDTGAVGKNLDTMIAKSEQKHKDETLKMIQQARQGGGSSSGVPQDSNDHKNNTKPPVKKPDQNSQDFWFMHQQNNQGQSTQPDPSLATFSQSTVVSPGSTSTQTTQTTSKSADEPINEQAILEKIHEKERRDALQTQSHHGKVLNPDGTTNDAKKEAPNSEKKDKQNVTTPVNPDILNLASNKDLNVATIQRQANKKDDDQDEVVISLH